MKAIIDAKVIEMNKTEAKAAGCFNTEEFRELAALRAAYYKPLPLQNQGGNHHEATDQLQSSRRLPE